MYRSRVRLWPTRGQRNGIRPRNIIIITLGISFFTRSAPIAIKSRRKRYATRRRSVIDSVWKLIKRDPSATQRSKRFSTCVSVTVRMIHKPPCSHIRRPMINNIGRNWRANWVYENRSKYRLCASKSKISTKYECVHAYFSQNRYTRGGTQKWQDFIFNKSELFSKLYNLKIVVTFIKVYRRRHIFACVAAVLDDNSGQSLSVSPSRSLAVSTFTSSLKTDFF